MSKPKRNKKNIKKGRPKLPKSKKVQPRKAKYKGVRYIAKHLRGTYNKKKKKWIGGWKQYRHDRQAASLRAREIFDSLQGKVSVAGIYSLQRVSREERKKNKAQPELPLYLIDPQPYYSLSEYPDEILLCDPKVTFTSKIIPKGLPPIVGGMEISYTDYFKPFVDFINKQAGLLKQNTGREFESGDDEWQVMCTEPRPDHDIKGRWISRIISCDADGHEVDYAFDNKEPLKDPLDVVTSEGSSLSMAPGEKKKKGVDSSSTSVTSSDNLDKQITLKEKEIELSKLQLKSQTISDAKELLRDKVITFEQYKELINLNK